MHSSPKPFNAYERWALYVAIAVVVAASLMFLYRLGDKPFWDYDEAIYANVVIDTLHSGDLLTLHSGSEPWFEKPPLYFWTSIGFDTVFHHPEFSYRLTAALAAIASIILTMLITYELSGSYVAALISGLILLSTAAFFEAGRELRLDVPATLGSLLSVYCFLRGQKDKRWLIGIGLGFALGFLFKNVIGLFSIFFILSWSLVYWDLRWLKSIYAWIGGVLFLVLFLPWHLYETFQYGSVFWQTYLIDNTIGRFGKDLLTQSVSDSGYATFFLAFGAPWTALFGLLTLWLLSQFKSFNDQKMKPIFTCAIATLLMLGVFIITTTKILAYLVPSYPYVAITLAVGLWYLLSQFNYRRAIVIWTTVAFAALLALGLWVTINFGFHNFSYSGVNDLIVQNEKGAALIIGQDKQNLPIYSYQYDYYDTIDYYSGHRGIQQMSDNQVLDKPFFLVASTPYMAGHAFATDLLSHMQVMYQGQVLTLYKFTP